jgi:hypothetical protein
VLPWDKSLNNNAFGGGFLNDADYQAATYTQQQEAKNKLQGAYDEAKTANEERYAEILAGYGKRYRKTMGSLKGFGDAEREALNRAYGKSEAVQVSNAVKSGLLGTTVPAAMVRQNTDAKARSMSLLNERLNREKLGYQTGLSGEKLAFMERREDTYPQLQYYMDLIKQFGSV